MVKSNIIEYTVNKASNNGIYISVQNGEVLVNAPWYFTKNQIQEVVEEKRKWIIKKISEYEIQKINKKNFTNKTIKLLGSEYNTIINYEKINIPEVNMKKEKIEILLPNKYKKIDNTEILKLIINKIYTSIAEREIEMAMEKARVLFGFAPEDYVIEKMENTLGKCENNVITINPNIVLFDRKIIQYVVMHEYCHLKYKTHSKKFNNLLEMYEKNWKKYENKLKIFKY